MDAEQTAAFGARGHSVYVSTDLSRVPPSERPTGSCLQSPAVSARDEPSISEKGKVEQQQTSPDGQQVSAKFLGLHGEPDSNLHQPQEFLKKSILSSMDSNPSLETNATEGSILESKPSSTCEQQLEHTDGATCDFENDETASVASTSAVSRASRANLRRDKRKAAFRGRLTSYPAREETNTLENSPAEEPDAASPKSAVVEKRVAEPRRPPNAYQLFVIDTRPTLTGDTGENAKTLSALWSGMDEAIKKSYKKMAQDLMRSYDSDWANFKTASKASSSNDPAPLQRVTALESCNDIAIQCNIDIDDEGWQQKYNNLKERYDEMESVVLALSTELTAVRRMAGLENSDDESDSETSREDWSDEDTPN